MDVDQLSIVIGKPHLRLDRVDSTNRYAVDYLSKNNPTEGTAISAHDQYQGRGQIGRFWESEAGKNITCSTIFYPRFLAANQQFWLNMAVSLAVKDLIDYYLPDRTYMIKWPNDLYVDDNKIAGLLVQNTLNGKSITSAIVGTGININQIEFSPHIPNPTSIARMHQEVELEDCFGWLFRFLAKRYLQLKLNKHDTISTEYHAALYRREVVARYRDLEGTTFSAKLKGVDDIGRLLMEDAQGKLTHYAFREIQYVI